MTNTAKEEREAIVAWLRSDNGPVPGYTMDLHDADDIADAIERGEHIKEQTNDQS